MISKERWHSFSIAEQMGNIGAEVARIRFWDERGGEKEKMQAFERALELIDLTLADPRVRQRAKEVARFREILADAVTRSETFQVTLLELEEYCLPFALIARMRKV